VAALECSRFVLLDECPANAESWLLARTFEALLASDVRGVVSFYAGADMSSESDDVVRLL
jgi:hypothetical protein